MEKIKHHSTDKTYKFIYKVLGIRFHRYLYGEGEKIEFLDTEIPDTAQRRDITTRVDGKFIRNTEFLSTPLYDDKMHSIYDYHQDLVNDRNNCGLEVVSSVVNTSNPNWGRSDIDIDSNINFHLETIHIQKRDGWKVLSNIIYKTITQEELSDNEAIDLLILPDMDIDIRIKSLMKLICFLICHANIADVGFKKDIVLCEIKVLERFFEDEELSEMIDMLRCDSEIPEIARVIEKYGPGFDVIYFDGKAEGIAEGKAEGIAEGKAEGIAEAKLESARKGLIEGVDEEVISILTGFSIDQLEEIKRKL